jgi:hypothetical protein
MTAETAGKLIPNVGRQENRPRFRREMNGVFPSEPVPVMRTKSTTKAARARGAAQCAEIKPPLATFLSADLARVSRVRVVR